MAQSRLPFWARLRLVVIGLVLIGFGAFAGFGPPDFPAIGVLVVATGVLALVLSYKGRTLQSYLG